MRRVSLFLSLPAAVAALAGTGCQQTRSSTAPVQVQGASFAPTMQELAPTGERVTAQPAAAVASGSSPGQLTILDRKGQPAGICPLAHTDVQADIAGYVSRVTVAQEFTNPSKTPIEAVYTFPLPGAAAVDDMTLKIGDRLIEGEIMKRDEAREVYEEAKAAGQSAALLDQERPNIFTQSVANIMPGQKITVVIRYVNLLKYEEGKYEFVFPMVVGPRYTPGGGYVSPGKRGEPSPPAPESDPGSRSTVTDADKITPPITPPGTRAGHDISVTVNLNAGIPIQEVGSVQHTVLVDRKEPNRAAITLKNARAIPNKDFILRYSAAGSELQTGVLAYAPEKGKGSGYFTLIFQPPVAPPQNQITPKEMVFVIDQTGSQQGFPIEKSKETMRHALRNLNPGDTFQLIGFNTDIFPCFPAPVPNTPENVEKALAFLKPLEGNGGTDILKSVDYALKMQDDPDRLRIVCYLTDGYVGNDMQIIDYIAKNRGRARIFPFGIGSSVNRFLIDGMAREGRGQAEVITLEEEGKGAAERFYRRVAHPLLVDVQVEWNGLPVADVFPRHIPDVFTATPIIVKGRYTRAGEGDITIRGLLRGKPWKQTLHVRFPAAQGEGSAIATLWAREKIEDLQNQDWLGQQMGRPKPDIQSQIVATALEYRLMSQHTSFVAVEKRVVNVGGRQITVDVPVEMPEGVSYEGIFGAKAEGREMAKARGGRMQVAQRARGMSLAAKAPASLAAGASGGSGGAAAGKSIASNAPAALAPSPSLRHNGAAAFADVESLVEADAFGLAWESELRAGKPEAQARLKTLKPEEKRRRLEQAKMHPGLHDLARRVKREGRNGALTGPGDVQVTNGRIEVMVKLNGLPPDGLRQLKALGFEIIATLTPNRLLLVRLSVEKLAALAEMPFVRRIEPPKYR